MKYEAPLPATLSPPGSRPPGPSKDGPPQPIPRPLSGRPPHSPLPRHLYGRALTPGTYAINLDRSLSKPICGAAPPSCLPCN